MRKFLGKFKIVWFFIKAVFSTDIDINNNNKSTDRQSSNWKNYQNTVKEFLAKYNTNAEDRVDYTNTREHHFNNFNHLDNPNHPEFKDSTGGDRVLERVGLIYENDGKTPRNPAEVFDMTYEEYAKYKEKILPRAETKKISYNEIKQFLSNERTPGEAPKKKRKYYKKRKPKNNSSF